jgi:hypothetical protein
MSFRRPKSHYKRRAPPTPSTDSLTTSAALVSAGLEDGAGILSVSDIPRSKRPRHSTALFLPGPEELITLPGRVTLTQRILLDLRGLETYESTSTPKSSHQLTSTPAQHASSDSLDPDTHLPDIDYMTAVNQDEGASRRQAAQRKKARLRTNWMSNLIPLLLPHHLRLLCDTKSLRTRPNPPSRSCSCTPGRTLTIICLYFQRKRLSVPPIFSDVFVLDRSRIYYYQCLYVFSSCCSAPLARIVPLRPLRPLSRCRPRSS